MHIQPFRLSAKKVICRPILLVQSHVHTREKSATFACVEEFRAVHTSRVVFIDDVVFERSGEESVCVSLCFHVDTW